MKILSLIALLGLFVILGISIRAGKTQATDGVLDSLGDDLMTEKPTDYPVATLAGGCFWCLESEFRSLDGVLYTRVGYIGGQLDDPGYRDITAGQTGHAEAVEITFDPEQITYKELVKYFLTKAHDPTQVNRQGVDVGTQYRSEIFYHNEEQKQIAQQMIEDIDAQKIYAAPIATKVSAVGHFWEGEDYHQQYYEKYEKDNGSVHPRVIYKKRMKGQ